MQNEQEKPALEDLKVTEETPTASGELIPLEQSEEETKNDAKSKKATVAAVAAGLAGGIAGTALGAQNADLIGGIFENDEPVAVEPDPDPHAGPADEPTPQNNVPQDESVDVVPEAAPVAEDPTAPANTPEPIAVDLNNDGTVDAIAIDADHDGTAEGMAIDQDHDGKVDTYYIDTDHDGDMDTIMIDTNQDGTPDSENTLATDQEITLHIEDAPDAPQEEVPQDTTVVDTPEAVDNTNDVVDNDIPQDEFDPNADMSEWA